MDVDGVIFDSNRIKEDNIEKVASRYLKGKELKDFLNFFVRGNGIPRETKIAKFFGEGTKIYHEILDSYNNLNHETLQSAPLTNGVREFLEVQSRNLKIWAVSGGAEDEVKDLFHSNKITHFFKGIHGGPTKKKAHLDAINPEKPITYVGDSKVDHESANHIGADFIFMYQYTQFDNWEQYFRQFPEVRIVRNLSEL